MFVDGIEYKWKSSVECAHGSGDNREEWSYGVYEGGGHRFLYNKDKEKTYLYLKLEEEIPESEVVKVWEECPADKITSSIGLDFEDATISWVKTSKRFDKAPAPFALTNQAMIIKCGEQRVCFLSIPIFGYQSEKFFSARFPAKDLPQVGVESHLASSSSANY